MGFRQEQENGSFFKIFFLVSDCRVMIYFERVDSKKEEILRKY
jgi:hypothetical protein